MTWTGAKVAVFVGVFTLVTVGVLPRAVFSRDSRSNEVRAAIGATTPAIGAPEPSIGTSRFRAKPFHLPPRSVPLFGFWEGPSATVIVLEPPPPAAKPEVTEPPRPPSSAVFFIERCGKFIRVPLPEAQAQDTTPHTCESEASP